MNYSNSEKSAIVAEYKQGVPVKGLNVKYKVSERTIYHWIKQYPIVAKGTTSTVKEYNQLLKIRRYYIHIEDCKLRFSCST